MREKDSYDSILFNCTVAMAELEILDSTNKTPEEKVERLQEFTERRLIIQTAVLKSVNKNDFCIQNLNPDSKMNDKLRAETQATIDSFLKERQKNN